MAKRISHEEIRLDYVINGDPAKKELYQLEQSTRKLNATNKELRAEKTKLRLEGKKGGEEYKKLSAEISKNSLQLTQNKTRMAVLTKQIGITGLTMGQLQTKANILRLTLRNMVPGSAKYKEYERQLQKVNARLSQLRGNAKGAKFSLSNLAQGFNKYGVMAASFIAALTGVVFKLQQMIDYNGQLSDSMADVMKTTQMTKKEVKELAIGFGLLHTRTSRINLLKIAEEGGRIGIVKEEISEFVDVMNKATVALGDTFPGGVSEVASKLGKLKFLFKETKDLGVDKAYNAIGSALNELGAKGIATEANIAAFATRVGALPDALKPTIGEALGLGAAFDESGIMVEKAGRAYEIFISAAAVNTEKFAKVMGITNQEVIDLINTNPTEFFLQFSESLSGMNTDGVAMSKTLKDLGLNASAVKGIVGAAANNTARFREQIDLSNKSMEEGTSLIKEYNIKNNNLAATLDKIKKKTLGWFSSKGLVSFLEASANGFARLIGAVEDSTDSLADERLELLKLESKIKDVNILEGDRIALIDEFQRKYPGYLKNLDAEKVTNEQLTTAIREVNNQLINKIILQEKDTEIEKQNADSAKKRMEFIEQEAKVRLMMGDLAIKEEKLIKDNASVEDQALDLLKQLGDQQGGRLINPVVEFSHQLANLQTIENSLNHEVNKGNILREKREALAKRLNITLGDPKSNSTGNNNTNEPKEGDVKTENGKTYVFKNGTWVVKSTYVPTTTPDSAKINQLKQEQKELLNLERQFEDNKLALLDAGYAKEKAIADAIHLRKIQDLKAKLATEEQIKASDHPELLKQKNKAINKLIESEEEVHQIRIATIKQKGIDKSIQDIQESFEFEKTIRERQFLEYLNSLNVTDAKKKQLQDQFNAQELTRQEQHLRVLIEKLKNLMEAGEFEGFDLSLLTPAQQTKFEKQIEDLKLKIQELVKAKKELSGSGGDGEGIDFGGAGEMDILGFTAEQWEDTFTNITDLEGVIAASTVAVQAFMNAWSMYDQMVTANENKQMALFEANTNRKKDRLANQLDSGAINQEEYNIKITKLDAQLDKTKRELEYQHAKRAWKMQLVAAISQAAMGVLVGLTAPFPLSIPMAAIAGIMGAIQVGIVNKNKPVKGFQDGLYPMEREQDGKMFNVANGGNTQSGVISKPTYFMAAENNKPEMIIDNNAFRKMNPDVRNSMIREVARVKGFENGYYSQASKTPEYAQNDTSTNDALMILISQNIQVLNQIKDEGIIAIVSSKDYKNMKEIKEGIENYNTLRNKNKI